MPYGTGQDELMDLDAVADELYGLAPEDFISARADREKEAKATDNKQLAAEIHRLTKPNAVGWLVNQLVRSRNNDIQTLLELGSRMREATASLSGDLRELSRQQRQVIRGLVQQAEQLAKAAGRPVSADTARSLDETFSAALADPGAADALAAGRLTAGLSSTGFASLGGSDSQVRTKATKLPSRTGKRERTGPDQGGERRQRAESTAANAKSLAGQATQAREEEYEKLQQVEQRAADAGNRVEQLRTELRKAVEAESKANKERRVALAAWDRADRRARRAEQRLTDAVSELEQLDR